MIFNAVTDPISAVYSSFESIKPSKSEEKTPLVKRNTPRRSWRGFSYAPTSRAARHADDCHRLPPTAAEKPPKSRPFGRFFMPFFIKKTPKKSGVFQRNFAVKFWRSNFGIFSGQIQATHVLREIP